MVRVGLLGSLLFRHGPSEVSREAQRVYQPPLTGQDWTPNSPFPVMSSSRISTPSCHPSSCWFLLGLLVSPLCIHNLGVKQSLEGNLQADFWGFPPCWIHLFWDLPPSFPAALATLHSVLKYCKLKRQSFCWSPSYPVLHGLGSALWGKAMKM